jgi:hypothetical protein
MILIQACDIIYSMSTFRTVFLTCADVNIFKLRNWTFIDWLLEGDIQLQNYWSMLQLKLQKVLLHVMAINILSLTIIILNVSVVSFAFHSRHLQHHHGRCRKSHDSSVSQARVAIGFFGISRNLSSTVESIERHAFDVLHRSNIRYWHA